MKLRLGDTLRLGVIALREGKGNITIEDLGDGYVVSIEFVGGDGAVLKKIGLAWDSNCGCWVGVVSVDNMLENAVKAYVVIENSSGYRESSRPINVEVVK